MRRIDYCVAFECHQGALEDPRPLCDKHWNGLRMTEREPIARLLVSDPMAARVLASLVVELPVREMARWVVDELGTFGTVHDSIAERDGYELDVPPWRELVDALFWHVNEHTAHLTAGRPWAGLEIALAMARTRTGIDQWQPLLIAAAVEFDEGRAGEPIYHAGTRKSRHPSTIPRGRLRSLSARARGKEWAREDPELAAVLEEHGHGA